MNMLEAAKNVNSILMSVMSKVIAQIYEVQTPSEAEKLIEFGVDHIGSVVLSQEQWKIPLLKDTINVIDMSNSRSSLIPLFSNLDSILCMLDYYTPDIVHFCEALTNQIDLYETCKSLLTLQENVKKRFPAIRIMRSIPIPQAGINGFVPVLELARMFEPVSDYFLTDTLLVKKSGTWFDNQPVKGFVGITGEICNWDIAARLIETSRIPVILAGGISPDNVYDGIMQVRPAGVDSCTGTNALDNNGRPIRFKKDPEKVKRFIDEIRRAEKFLG